MLMERGKYHGREHDRVLDGKETRAAIWKVVKEADKETDHNWALLNNEPNCAVR